MCHLYICKRHWLPHLTPIFFCLICLTYNIASIPFHFILTHLTHWNTLILPVPVFPHLTHVLPHLPHLFYWLIWLTYTIASIASFILLTQLTHLLYCLTSFASHIYYCLNCLTYSIDSFDSTMYINKGYTLDLLHLSLGCQRDNIYLYE